MRRNGTPGYPYLVLGLAVLAEAVLLVFFPGHTGPDRLPYWFSVSAGTLSVAAVPFLLGMIRSSYRSARSPLLLLGFVYLLPVLANPASVNFSSSHPAALALSAALLFHLRYLTREHSRGDLFLTAVFLSAASLAVPGLVWLAAAVLLLHPGRFFAVAGGILLPYLYEFAWLYLFRDGTAAAWLTGRLALATDWQPLGRSMPASGIFALAISVAVFAAAVFYLLVRNRNALRPSQVQAQRALAGYALGAGLVAALFGARSGEAWQTFAAIPMSLVIFDYLTDRFSDYEGQVLTVLWAGTWLMLRISQVV